MIDELNDVDNHINVECLYCYIQPLFTNSIVYLNVRSLVHKVNELESLLASLNLPKVVLLSET